MAAELSPGDALAVDLLVNDGAAVQTRNGASLAHPRQIADKQRVEAVSHLLNLIKQASVEQPPEDLLARTLRSVANASASEMKSALEQRSEHRQQAHH